MFVTNRKLQDGTGQQRGDFRRRQRPCCMWRILSSSTSLVCHRHPWSSSALSSAPGFGRVGSEKILFITILHKKRFATPCDLNWLCFLLDQCGHISLDRLRPSDWSSDRKGPNSAWSCRSSGWTAKVWRRATRVSNWRIRRISPPTPGPSPGSAFVEVCSFQIKIFFREKAANARELVK